MRNRNKDKVFKAHKVLYYSHSCQYLQRINLYE